MHKKPPLRRRPAVLAAFADSAAIALLALAAIASPAGQAVGQAVGPEGLGFTKSFIVEIRNPSPAALENHAIIIDVAAIRSAVAWDFNTYMYALF
jgi:hypothetical protein